MRNARNMVRVAAAGAVFAMAAALAAAEPVTVTIDDAETAGISGFRALWDTPIVLAEDGPVAFTDAVIKDRYGTALWEPARRDGGKRPAAIAVDSLQRTVLVRFPGAAGKVYEKVREGLAVTKAELVLPWRDTELWPPDQYDGRRNWGVDALYRKSQPRWHVVAWPVEFPWKADAETGPTYNSFLPGGGWWPTFGVSEAVHRVAGWPFGPTEVSESSPEGRMDVTAYLTGDKMPGRLGRLLGERLRAISENGFALRKRETYDHRYFTGVYEWATATGGRAILLKKPRLVVTLVAAKAGNPLPPLPPATDLAALAERIRKGEAADVPRQPAAAMPSARKIQEWTGKFAARPTWMTDLQWQRVRELKAADPKDSADEPFFYAYVPKYLRDRLAKKDKATKETVQPTPEQVYGLWVDQIIARQPRGWAGFEAAKEMTQWYLYRDCLPGPAREAIRRYWEAWLMPDRPTSDLVHPMQDQLAAKGGTTTYVGDSYFNKTGDWRGNKSFYRAGFNYTISTQNFNMSASAGALLGGAIIGSDLAMADGRHGQENYPARLWTWGAGSTQEHIDHYYYAITLSGNKAVRDFAPTPYDRLLADAMLTRGVEELVSCYHPALRRFIAGASRTSLEYLLVTQDGLQHIVHTMSRSGALHDLGNTDLPGAMPILGHDRTPRMIADQTLAGPWAPDWLATYVDTKPLPFEETHRHQKYWRRAYLGRHFGLASSDLERTRIQIMAQWQRQAGLVERMQDLVTMDMRIGVNATRWVNDAGGWISPYGHQYALQHKGKMIVAASPWPADFLKNAAAKNGLRSLQSSLALFNYQSPAPTWKIYVDDQPVTELPARARAGQWITVHDGVTYLAVRALPATDLGRTDEVVLEAGAEQTYEKRSARAALVVNSYWMKSAEPRPAPADWSAIDRACGGFIVELADAGEYADFAAFREHLRAARIETREDREAGVFHVKYSSGPDVLELGAMTLYESSADGKEAFAYRKVNGAWPYPAEGVDRDSSLVQQGTGGRLEKRGAVLQFRPGATGYLLTDPAGETVAAFNPLPDLTPWRLALPNGATVTADGRVGLLRAVAHLKDARIAIDAARKPGSPTPADDEARAMAVVGWPGDLKMEVNGRKIAVPTRTEIGGKPAFVIPLADGEMPNDLPERIRRAEESLAASPKR